ncbi:MULTISPECIES: citrate lyase acyl carrier protein [unclassified Oceanispirochaeta]|uniref:citrate lyase acyl carrier protein n=1 Tax=unclassified Oceanispirochaeta TaxID=2635722 RepID=UPI001313E3F2|nr:MULTISPECIES: citrate lyase acyl carrier protein [unclassified Oceanispirochaeta]MBF9018531.1 citrate lyase acyl carrier protein [Oceanispirochaeta sp. M2]NPD74938.1 citrate lyase acyl carrier protein [Oceanispirochaeta sp. M1]
METSAGSTGKSDVLVTVQRIKGDLKIELKSTLKNLYSESQKLIIKDTVNKLKEDHLLISVEDNQALDFVLKARLKAAVSALQRTEESS